MVGTYTCDGGGTDESLLECAGTLGLSCATHTLDATENAWASVERDESADGALVFLTTLACGATVRRWLGTEFQFDIMLILALEFLFHLSTDAPLHVEFFE